MSGKIRLNIDGREAEGFEGQTILEIALENGIEIPTLCHDGRVEMYGSCGLCVVEAEGSPKLLRSCSTYAADGMIINTNTKRVRENRRAALELLLSDHTGDCRPPCVLACPGQTDCQGYVGLIANGAYEEALKRIKEKIPLPASIGRVCPHPCEEACRRELVEEPISILALKQFVGDLNLGQGGVHTADAGPYTGKDIAVIGGGPGGLTTAYFLRAMGHGVTVYDAMPHMGGMLRYGIPEYRLPKKVLQEEIDGIEDMGVEFVQNIKIGRDLTLEYLRKTYDAVIVAVGAWSSTGLGCPGENLEGVLGGIDFLRDAALNNPVVTGRRIAIVGGGNTAMDACRTAVRLGASEVYNIYRRTKKEMPAEEIEIAEAEEEGVIFKNLTNPNEVIGENGKVAAVRLQIMELGEPDASGRRSPVPVPGKEETIKIDTLIVAIGQKYDPIGLEALTQTKRGTLAADEHTFRTNLDGVFAIGDATNKGADIAIAAIGEARRAAEMVDRYLHGEELRYEEPYLVKSEKTAEDFAHKAKEPRAKMPHRPPMTRRNDFLEINFGLGEEEARREAARCLECGCMDYYECKLVHYANQYAVRPEKYEGKVHHRAQEDTHPFIHRNPDKCILCGLCVRICDEVTGATALGLVGRGFDTIVKPALDMDLKETDCISCGQCVSVCPTGALTEKMLLAKQVPLRESFTETVCSFCSVGCKTKIASSGNLITRALTADAKDSLLCKKGRFGLGELFTKERLTSPHMRGGRGMEAISLEQAIVYANKSLQSLQTQYGADSVAVALSDRFTNEEAYAIREYARKALKTDKIFSFNKTESGLADVLGVEAPTASFAEMEAAELIVVVGPDIMKNHGVAGMRVKRAVRKGSKLLMLASGASLLDSFAGERIEMGNDLTVLKQVVRALLDGGCGKGIEGADKLAASVSSGAAGDAAKAFADVLRKARKTVFVFEKNALTRDAARLVADIAVLSGHAAGPRNGVIQLLPGPNSQGLNALGIGSGEDALRAIANGEIRGLFIFGEDIAGFDRSKIDFLAVQDLYMTKTAALADVVFPASSLTEVCGSVTSADGRVQEIQPAVAPEIMADTSVLVMELLVHAGAAIPLEQKSGAKPSEPQTVRLVPAEGNVLCRGDVRNTNGVCADFTAFAALHGC